MIAIATIEFDLLSARIFKGSKLKNDVLNRGGNRRMSRMKTLDGGVMFYDSGYTDADREIIIHESPPTLASLEYAQYMVARGGLLHISAADGCYTGVMSGFEVIAGELRIKIYINEKIA